LLAFVEWFEIQEETFGPVDVNELASNLQSREAIFVDTFGTVGSTQEAVVDALEELIGKHGIRVFVR
jgi:uracil phosphoribosyltransferase